MHYKFGHYPYGEKLFLILWKHSMAFLFSIFFCYLKKANRAIWFKNTLPVYCHVDQMSEKIK